MLGGDIAAQALHLDFDMDEVIFWKQSTVFLPSSRQSKELADLIYRTTVPPVKRNLRPQKLSDKSSFLNFSPLQNCGCRLIYDPETL